MKELKKGNTAYASQQLRTVVGSELYILLGYIPNNTVLWNCKEGILFIL
jgi:hypothetical protein